MRAGIILIMPEPKFIFGKDQIQNMNKKFH